MNSKLEKKIRKQAKNLMVSWLQSIVPDEEKDIFLIKHTSMLTEVYTFLHILYVGL